eukprot:6303375-Prymnesium_polylepis.1
MRVQAAHLRVEVARRQRVLDERHHAPERQLDVDPDDQQQRRHQAHPLRGNRGSARGDKGAAITLEPTVRWQRRVKAERAAAGVRVGSACGVRGSPARSRRSARAARMRGGRAAGRRGRRQSTARGGPG